MKLNFFARIYLAITDFRLYPFIAQKEKFITALAYFLGFIVLVAAILATNITTKVINWNNEFVNFYDTQVNEFVIKDGIFDISGENIDFDFLGVKVITDDTKGYEEMDFESLDTEDYLITILGLKDTVAIGNAGGFVLAKYTENLNIDKANVHKILKVLNESPLAKLSIAIMMFCAVFVAYLFTKFLNVVGITFMLLFLGYVFRTKYKFKDYMKVAFYVITLPVITEVIALLIAGQINEYAYITYYLLVYVYMYYAIRALKLDNIIMSTHEKIMGMKLNEDAYKDKIDNQEQQEETKETNNEEDKK